MTKPGFEKKCLGPAPIIGQNGPKWPKSRVFGHFLHFESAMIYLAGTGGYGTSKKYLNLLGPIVNLSPNYFCLQIHVLEIVSSVFANFAYDDKDMISNRRWWSKLLKKWP